MKKSVLNIALLAVLAVGFVGCENDSVYEETAEYELLGTDKGDADAPGDDGDDDSDFDE